MAFRPDWADLYHADHYLHGGFLQPRRAHNSRAPRASDHGPSSRRDLVLANASVPNMRYYLAQGPQMQLEHTVLFAILALSIYLTMYYCWLPLLLQPLVRLAAVFSMCAEDNGSV